MVICLEDEVLPYVPITVRHLLSNDQSRSLHDFIPLLNQIVNKFKVNVGIKSRKVMQMPKVLHDYLLDYLLPN